MLDCEHCYFYWPYKQPLFLLACRQKKAAPTGVKATIQETLPLDDLQRFTAVVEQIRKYYVKPVDDKELFENAIRGMLSGLDPHSAYLDESEFSDLEATPLVNLAA